MLRFMCIALMAGCAAPQIRPTKTAQSVATGERYKNSGGFLSEGGPDLKFGPDYAGVLLLAALGGTVLFFVARAAEDDRPKSESTQSTGDAGPAVAVAPAWARPLPR